MINKILMAIGFVFLVALAYLYLEIENLKGQRESLTKVQRPQASNATFAGNPKDDPYLNHQVKNTIVKKAKELQICYKDFLKTSPKNTSGTIKLDWQVQADGKVAVPGIIHNGLEDKNFGECVLAQITSLTFPPPPSGNTKYVEHSLHFNDEAALAADDKRKKEGPLVQLKK
ncbi:MAG: AgmX/PglI C-terminal domain-containing protein [SAR324 cluster bacterium]|nr:AgmX/PglI C-terminal domain-containing protein [SAR324 cluster bacterium]